MSMKRSSLLLRLAFDVILISVICGAQSYPTRVCVNGDVQSTFDQGRDARLLMGEYDQINASDHAVNTDIVDMSVPIYQTTATGNLSQYDLYGTETYFLFRVFGLGVDALGKGWVMAGNLALADPVQTIFATCHFEDLFDCVYNRWFWGFDSFLYDMPYVKVTAGACKSSICVRNLTLTVPVNWDNTTQNWQSPFEWRDFGSTLERSWDADANRYTWTSTSPGNVGLHWEFRLTVDDDAIANWVYIGMVAGQAKDLVACAPGARESPLYCTTFSYTYGNEHLPGQTLGASEFSMGACDETLSAPPTSQPTVLPTQSGELATECVFGGESYAINETVIRECFFGWYGPGDRARCKENGQVGVFEQRCFKTSFADDFQSSLVFDEELWSVYESAGVTPAAAAAFDGQDSLRLVPGDASRVGIVRSQYRIAWPLRVRAVVEKRAQECNLWSIALGSSWEVLEPSGARRHWIADGTRVSWNCLHGEDDKPLSLYNETLRLYDAACWTGTDMDDAMAVRLSLQQSDVARDGVSVRTNASSCTSLSLGADNIFDNDNGWQDAYVFFGSYYDDDAVQAKLNASTSVIGRFHSVYYTQFFSDFDALMPHIWDVDASSAIAETPDSGVFIDGASTLLLLRPHERLVSNTSAFQFSIPFMLKVGIAGPPLAGAFAHAIVIGAVGYSRERRHDAVQIVYDGSRGVKLVYTADAVYATGFGDDAVCAWNEVSEAEVTIVVDAVKISVHDSICDDTTIIATHVFTTVNHTLVSLAFIDPDNGDYGDAHRIGFSFIEAYQYQARYASLLVDMRDDSTNNVTAALEVIYRRKLSTVAWYENMDVILIGSACAGALLLCCLMKLMCACCVVQRQRKRKQNAKPAQNEKMQQPQSKQKISAAKVRDESEEKAEFDKRGHMHGHQVDDAVHFPVPRPVFVAVPSLLIQPGSLPPDHVEMSQLQELPSLVIQPGSVNGKRNPLQNVQDIEDNIDDKNDDENDDIDDNENEHVKLDESQFETWTSYQVVRWIVNINFEAHKQYARGLRRAFAADIVNGRGLVGITDGYLQECGVSRSVHRLTILQHINRVIQTHCGNNGDNAERKEEANARAPGEGDEVKEGELSNQTNFTMMTLPRLPSDDLELNQQRYLYDGKVTVDLF